MSHLRYTEVNFRHRFDFKICPRTFGTLQQSLIKIIDLTEEYSACQTSKMECIVKIANGFLSLVISQKPPSEMFEKSSEYDSAAYTYFTQYLSN